MSPVAAERRLPRALHVALSRLQINSHAVCLCACLHCPAHQVLQQANNFSAINCSNTLWAFASLRHYSPPLFAALLERLGCHLEEVEPQNVANALYALARVSHPLGDHAGVWPLGQGLRDCCQIVIVHFVHAVAGRRVVLHAV